MSNYLPTPGARKHVLEVAQAVLDWVGMIPQPNDNEIELRDAALKFLARAKVESSYGTQIAQGQAERTQAL